MFKVRNKTTGDIFSAYGITEDDNELVLFLLYIDGEWVWHVSSYYEPIE